MDWKRIERGKCIEETGERGEGGKRVKVEKGKGDGKVWKEREKNVFRIVYKTIYTFR